MGPSGAAIWSAPTLIPRSKGSTPRLATITPTRRRDLGRFHRLRRRLRELAWARQITSEDAFTVACPRGSTAPNPMGRTLISARPPFSRIFPDGKRVLVAGQKSGVVTALDPDHGGASSGKRESARAAPWAVCNGASQRMKAMSTSRCPTLNCGACRLELPARKLLPSIRALRSFWTARAAAALRPQARYGRTGLADPASRLWRRSGMQPRPVGRSHRYSRVGVLGRTRRTPARLFRRQRQDRLGRGYKGRLSDRQRRRREGRVDRWRRSRHCRRRSLCRIGVRVCRIDPRQRLARILGRRIVTLRLVVAVSAVSNVGPLSLRRALLGLRLGPQPLHLIEAGAFRPSAALRRGGPRYGRSGARTWRWRRAARPRDRP